MTLDDPAIAAIHEVRHQISASHSHDPRLLVEYYRELERKYQSRVLPSHDDAMAVTVSAYEPVETTSHVLAEVKSADDGDKADTD